ncbi:MAG: hypothetical protein V4637_01025 [Pseudomonadota bacterium]
MNNFTFWIGAGIAFDDICDFCCYTPLFLLNQRRPNPETFITLSGIAVLGVLPLPSLTAVIYRVCDQTKRG